MTSLSNCPGAKAEVLPAGRLSGEGGDGIVLPHAATENCQAGGRQVNAMLIRYNDIVGNGKLVILTA